jgi:hypothetical protein
MRTGAVSITLASLVLLPCWGCSKETPYGYGAQTVPVKGKVTYKGQPLTQGSITFEPDGSGREAHGGIQPDGTFVLTTFKEGDGAVAGVHRVAVRGTGKGGKEVVPVKYRDTSSSKVQVEVTEGKTDYTIDFP